MLIKSLKFALHLLVLHILFPYHFNIVFGEKFKDVLNLPSLTESFILLH